MMLPPDLARVTELQGAGEPHPIARLGLILPTAMMVYGPRDRDELEIVWNILRASHAFATGASSSALRARAPSQEAKTGKVTHSTSSGVTAQHGNSGASFGQQTGSKRHDAMQAHRSEK